MAWCRRLPLQRQAATPAKRFGAVYVPNGVEMRMWTPKAEGAGFGLSPILEPLAPFRDQTFVLSGLADKVAVPLPGEGIGDHARASSTWLTGVRVQEDGRAGHPRGGVAGPVGGAAPGEGNAAGVAGAGAGLGGGAGGVRRRVQLRVCEHDLRGGRRRRRCRWRTIRGRCSSGCSGRATARTRRRGRRGCAQDRSILDFVTDEVKALNRALGAGDRGS